MKSESASELRKVFHSVASTVNALESIGRPITNCEDLFVHLCAELLDSRTRREWEHSVECTTNPPSYDTLRQFLEHHMHTLEIIQASKSDSNMDKSSDSSTRAARTHHAQKKDFNAERCAACKENYFLMFCDKCRNKAPLERKQLVEANHLCINCLGKHKVSDCSSKRTCSVCFGGSKPPSRSYGSRRGRGCRREGLRPSHRL